MIYSDDATTNKIVDQSTIDMGPEGGSMSAGSSSDNGGSSGGNNKDGFGHVSDITRSDSPPSRKAV